MKIKLLELRPYMIDENIGVYEMFNEIPLKDKFEENEFNGLSKLKMKTLIKKYMKNEYNINHNSSIPKKIVFILFYKNYPIGKGSLKITLDNFLKIHNCTLSYVIRPSMQNKGFGTILAKELIKRARLLGLHHILAQCNKENLYSKKILEKLKFKQYDPKNIENISSYFYERNI
jgi:RimJ/RimL family protein N-acetyltransferase